MKNKKNKEERARALMSTPTPYVFNFLDVPMESYVEVLTEVFHNPDFKALEEKRNRLVSSVQYMKSHSAESVNACKVIEQYDRKLAYILYSLMVQANLKSPVTYETLQYSTLLKYHVDYSRKDMTQKVTALTHNLNKLTFLADMLEQIVVDIKGEMNDIFKGDIEFKQFDAVVQVLKQMKGFFNAARPTDTDSPEAKLYLEYSDSINAYMEKRMKTFSEKYAKYNPVYQGWTEHDMVKAMNQFFGTKDKFGYGYIVHSQSGGVHIDAMKLVPNLSVLECEKLDKAVGYVDKSPTAIDTYSYKVTDVIMNAYKPQ